MVHAHRHLGKTLVHIIFTTCAFLLAGATAQADWSVSFGKGRSGSWGVGTSYNYDNALKARAGSVASCKVERKGKCKEVWRGQSGCVAVAVTYDNNGWGMSSGNSEYSAMNDAMRRCLTGTNVEYGCRIVAHFCDHTHGFTESDFDPSERANYEQLENYSQLLRDQRRANQRVLNQQSQQYMLNLLGTLAGNIAASRNRPASRPSRYRNPTPSYTGGGHTNCPGATIAVDENCRPLH